MFKKQLENKFNSLVQTMPETYGQTTSFELEFVSNFQVRSPASPDDSQRLLQQAIQTGVRNTFGYVRSSPDASSSSPSVNCSNDA
jgi:hypothetical protein